MALSSKQQAFASYYLICGNGAEAARLAGYSAKTARQQASRLLTNVDIRAEVEAGLAAVKMEADETLKRLADQARASMSDFVKVDAAGQMDFDFKKAQGSGKLHLLKKFKKTERTTKGMTETTFEIELHDAQTALQLLGRHHKLFIERTEHTGKDGAPLGLSPEMLEILQALGYRPSDAVTAFETIIRREAEKAGVKIGD